MFYNVVFVRCWSVDFLAGWFCCCFHLCPEMCLTLNLVTLYKTERFASFIYLTFIYDRIICLLVRIYGMGHLVMSIIQLTHLINAHFWTYLLPIRTERFKNFVTMKYRTII